MSQSTVADYAILIDANARAVVSFIGIVLVVGGVWVADRRWDELGSAAYAREEAKLADAQQRWEAKPAGVRQRTAADSADDDRVEVTILDEDLDAAFPFPTAFLAGWMLIAVSYLVGSQHASSVLGAVFSATIGVVASVPMGDAVRYRKGAKKRKLGLLFVLSWIGLSVSTALDADGELRGGGINLGLCLFGAVCIIASMRVLWKHRKMGDSWERYGRPNENAVVYQPGGPLFVLGFFLVWIAMNGTLRGPVACSVYNCGLPIFLNLRTALAVLAGCGMVPIVMMVDYAHDEGAEFVGFGTDGRFFGRFFESPLPFFLAWIGFAVAGSVALDNSTTLWGEPRTLIIVVICALQCVVAGYLIQTALYKGDMGAKNKWSIVFLVLFVSLAINMGFNPDYDGLAAGGLALALSLPGALLVVAGQKAVFGDRKRGDHFMLHHEPNPNAVVYSPGLPLFMFGWIALSLSMSLGY